MNTNGSSPGQQASEFVFTRTFNAPRELVFRAWTEAEMLSQWWGPKGFRCRVDKLELRPGGRFHYCLEGPDGREMWGLFVWGQINPPESIEYVNSFSNAAGKVTRAPFSEEWPLRTAYRVSFSEQDGLTTLELRGRPLEASAEELALYSSMFDSMRQGFGGSLDQLEQYLAGMQ